MIRALPRAGVALSAILALSAPAVAQPRSAPTAVPIPPSVPAPADTPYPGGPISLVIDASDTQRAVWRVTETIPVAPGTTSLILQLPEWVPGDHRPSGTMQALADVRFFVGGKLIPWHRDLVNVYAFHLDLPTGASEVVAKFIHTSPLQPSEGQITMTREMLNLEWDRMSLYPAGHYVRQIRIKPKVTLPQGWTMAGALDGKTQSGAEVSWAETDYETLIDSPLYAGVNFKRFELGHGVALNAVADHAADLDLSSPGLTAYRALVDEALITFGSQHFDHYDFLLGLTDRLGDVGLEHHRSSENTMTPKSFTQWEDSDWNRNILPHEFAHSWDGKFRRPARLWTPYYRTPMQDDLLWVYEGQTQFWGLVLAVRSGVQSKDMVLGEMANYAGLFSQLPGRGWRSVEDTTLNPVIAARRPKPFASLDRGEDYYTEGALVWLEADQIIRAGTGGKKGLDDFARGFFGIRNGDWGEATYELADVVAALNAAYAYDWATFLTTRIATPDQPAPLAGIEKAGYKLVWKIEPNAYDKARMAHGKYLSLYHSIGITLDKDGRVTGCRWDSAAFNAGLMPGAKILAVNGTTYDQDSIKAAITAATGQGKPVELIVQRGDKVLTLTIDYHDGLRWPWLERANGAKTAPLDLLLKPRRPDAK